MSKIETVSAKGELVDFDLLRLKQQIGTMPKPLVVEEREMFINNKFKRKLNRQLNNMLDEQPSDPDPKPTNSSKKTIKEDINEHKSDL